MQRRPAAERSNGPVSTAHQSDRSEGSQSRSGAAYGLAIGRPIVYPNMEKLNVLCRSAGELSAATEAAAAPNSQAEQRQGQS